MILENPVIDIFCKNHTIKEKSRKEKTQDCHILWSVYAHPLQLIIRLQTENSPWSIKDGSGACQKKGDQIMKKTIRTLVTAMAIGACMCVPAFAAETKEEFQAESESYYTQMKELNAQIDPLRENNKQLSDKFQEIGKAYKESGTLPVSEDTWNQVKELRKSLSAYQSDKSASTVKEIRAAAKAAAGSGDYDAALTSIKEAVASKEARLEKAKAANDIWHQIDALLG